MNSQIANSIKCNDKSRINSISFFHGSISSNEIEKGSLHSICEGIKSGRWKGEVEKARNLDKRNKEEKEHYNALKKQLPSFVVSGIFSKREKSGFMKSSGYIIIDIDDIHSDHLENTASRLKKDEYTKVLFLSPSAMGFKIVVETDLPVLNDFEHKQIFKALGDYYKESYGIKIDLNGSDICRACFISFDPNLFFNEKNVAFNFKKEISVGRKKIQKVDLVVEQNTNKKTVNVDSTELNKLPQKALKILNGEMTYLDTGHDSQSECDQAAIVSLIAKGIDEHTILKAFECLTPPNHKCRKRGSVYSRDYIHRSILSAKKYLKKRENSDVIRILSDIDQIQFSGRSSRTDKDSLYTILQVAQELGKISIGMSCRDLGIKIGVAFKTASKSLIRLVKAGYLSRSNPENRSHSITYEIKVQNLLNQFSDKVTPIISQRDMLYVTFVENEKKEYPRCLSEDVFRRLALSG